MAYYSNTRKALQETLYSWVPIDSTADTALAAITTSSTVKDVLVILNACIARKLQTDRDSQNLASSVLTKSTIATVSNLVTVTAGTASQSAASATVRVGDATITVDTDENGDLDAVNITGGGTNYKVGDVIMVDFVGSGVGYFTVATVS